MVKSIAKNIFIAIAACIICFGISSCSTKHTTKEDYWLQKADSVLTKMTLREKVGQLIQVNSAPQNDSLIKEGIIGSILNENNVENINKLQKIAVEQSRMGIPVLFARDVIHGFNTIMPIPLGQAASWNTELVELAANIAATEARANGIYWTFAPMIDISRDPRWGRIAESFGEDPYLTSVMAVASIKGYQGNNLAGKNSIAACAKHFAAYGAAEAGRDYNTVTIPENELRDIYLPPFKAATDAGVATFMTAFNEINGIPCSGSEFLTRQLLRDEWGFDGMVVSDWGSIEQLTIHGFTKNEKEAAERALKAGVDMEMVSNCYKNNLTGLLSEGKIDLSLIDNAVRNILILKFKLGLFDNPYTKSSDYPEVLNDKHKGISRKLATESIVLLKNNNVLPLNTDISSVAIIGPLANAPHDQMGTWVFDGDKKNSITPLTAIKELLGAKKVNYAPGMDISRTVHKKGFSAAIKAAKQSEIVLLFIGEESILSGEAHCRADISLPGVQSVLIDELSKTGKPLIGIVMAGRQVTFEEEAKKLDAILYTWHAGNMAGPAIADIIFGKVAPSGKLPVTFPRTVGQIPIYYAHKNSGKPATYESWEPMYNIPAEAPQFSIGATNHHMDYGFEPWYPFGFGLSYVNFEYSNIKIEKNEYNLGDTLVFYANVTNKGTMQAKEVVQLYIRDLVGSRTRPVKELKAYEKLLLQPGQTKQIVFKIHTSLLGFYNPTMDYITEAGDFSAGIGGSSDIELNVNFLIKK